MGCVSLERKTPYLIINLKEIIAGEGKKKKELVFFVFFCLELNVENKEKNRNDAFST